VFAFFFQLLIGAVVFGFAVYMTVVIPTLRTIVTPEESDTRQDRIEAMSILSAGNIIIMVCLGLVLLLQVGGRVSVTMYMYHSPATRQVVSKLVCWAWTHTRTAELRETKNDS
jgi:hypothetical protein